MLKRTFHYLLAFTVVALSITACKDQFTEEDLLEQQQTIDLSIYVTNESVQGNPAVAGAKVVISQDGASIEGTTDEAGAVVFNDLRIGGVVYRITKENFVEVSGTLNLNTSNFRQGQISEEISILSSEETTFATIKGRLDIETDLTTRETEYAGGVKVGIIDETSDIYYETTTDDEGRYEIQIPAKSSGTYVRVVFPDIEVDQKFITMEYSDDPFIYPWLDMKPVEVTQKTLFKTNTDNLNNYRLPTDIPALYAVVEAPPVDGEQAYISSVDVNSDGEITDVNFYNGGDYTGATDNKVTVTFISLRGGSGATLEIDVTNFSNLSTAMGNDDFTLEGGSGYPYFWEDRYINHTDFDGPNNLEWNEFEVFPNTISTVNGDYGTGTYRESDPRTEAWWIYWD